MSDDAPTTDDAQRIRDITRRAAAASDPPWLDAAPDPARVPGPGGVAAYLVRMARYDVEFARHALADVRYLLAAIARERARADAAERVCGAIEAYQAALSSPWLDDPAKRERVADTHGELLLACAAWKGATT